MKKILYFLTILIFPLISASQKSLREKLHKKEPFHVRALETALIGIPMSAAMSAAGGALYSFSSAAQLLLKFYQIKNIPRALGWGVLGVGYTWFAGLLAATLVFASGSLLGGGAAKKMNTRKEKKEMLKMLSLLTGLSLLSILFTIIPINLYEKFTQEHP